MFRLLAFLCPPFPEHNGGPVQVVRSKDNVIGVDMCERMVHRAARSIQSWLSYSIADAAALPFEDNKFDVAIGIQVAEHVPDIDAVCSATHQIMKTRDCGVVLATG